MLIPPPHISLKAITLIAVSSISACGVHADLSSDTIPTTQTTSITTPQATNPTSVTLSHANRNTLTHKQSVFPQFPADDSNLDVANWTVEIVERVPHDPNAFTQGLEITDHVMYESTGLYGQSSIRMVDPSSGTLYNTEPLSNNLFGEGLTVVDDYIYQLTWRSGRMFVYDRNTLERVNEYEYEGEGWGLCRMGDVLWMSDGSDTLTQRDIDTFESIRTVTVTSPSGSVTVNHLNELECVEGKVIANVWQTNYLLVIDVNETNDARVSAVIHADTLVEDAEYASSVQTYRRAQPDVLNGIADTRDGSGTLWLTGKLWPYVYRVKLIPYPPDSNN